jgi:MFS transporter, ACS family, tartrate transporter
MFNCGNGASILERSANRNNLHNFFRLAHRSTDRILAIRCYTVPIRRGGCGMNSSPSLAESAVAATTIHKLRMRVIPFVFVLFVVNFVDRINIGIAALTMNIELGITSQQYGFIAGIFFFGYFMFEVPSNLMLHKVGARLWLARILISWGIVAMLTGLAKSVTHLYLLRFLLGVAEAGYVPGIYLYLTYWFPQRHLAQAIALFNTGFPVASVVGFPLSGVILDHIHWFGLSSWRWLLVLEGIPAVVGGIVTYFLLPSRPAEAKFLTNEQRDYLATELTHAEQQKGSRVTIGQTLVHTRVWHLIAIYFTFCVGLQTMIFWMPQLLKDVSGQYSNTTIGILVMIPYLCGLAAMVLVAHRSDRTLERRFHAAVPATIGALSLVLLGVAPINSALFSVLLWCSVASGLCSLFGPFWSLPNEFLKGFPAAAGIALINSVGNLGGFVGPYAMGAINQRTGSFRGGFVFAGISLFASAMLILALRKRIAPEMGQSQ